MRSGLSDDDLIGVGVDDEIGVVRDHDDLPPKPSLGEERHEFVEDGLRVEIFLGLIDNERAIVRSSNLATNQLLQHVGLPAVAQVLASAGAAHSHVRRGIQDVASLQAAPAAGNDVTAADLAALLQALATGRLLPPGATDEVLYLLSQVEDNDAIPAGLPAGTWCAHKPGWIEGACHDAALVRPTGEQAFVLVILTRADLPEEAGFKLVAKLTRACWDARASLAEAA